ncbi:MAG TPA: DUF4340 domain-containing protein [Acidobacteriota bacterium]|jgi:hypothetical protein|nr:DUF4340 domain-containing protein [Acidobacteriota bacterium]HRR25727.1 DUF4340 domain-containing protein [Acidobacteriota bacterium]HRR55599.1 DUF4340 domain-containing protein [Acidobacteriota bacterium]HRV07528.1 DUF4340 domain-containing protein [Acidobacteriota bacterium]
MRRLVILLVIFLGLAGFVYFYEIAGREKREKAEELASSLLGVEQDQITLVEIRRPGGESIRLEKVNDQWVLRAPVEAVADRTNVDSLVRNLSTAKRERSFEQVSPEDLEAYGLKNPPLEILIKAGEEEKTILLGNKDFSGNNLYVQVAGAPEVFLTSSFLMTAADKKVDDWRSKDVLVFDRGKVEEIELRRGEEVVRLVRKDETWRLVDPIEDPADQTKVSSLLGTLEFARVEEFVSESPDDLKEFGLDRPSVTVRLRLAGSDTWLQLDLGKEAGENYYARDPQRKPVFTVKKSVYDDLMQDLIAFRDKDVVNVNQNDVKSLEIRHGGEVVRIRREEFRWLGDSPEAVRDKEIPPYRLWYPLDDLRFVELADGWEPDRDPDTEVVILQEDGTERRFRFWQEGETVWAERVEDGRAGKIDLEEYKKIITRPEELVQE